MGKEDLAVLPRILNKSYETLYVVVSTGRSKELLGKNIVAKELDSMSNEEIEAYYKIYELNYADRINNHLIGTIYGFYTYAVNKFLPIDDVEKLREDLDNDYILTTELKCITGGLAATCSKFMAVVSLGITTLKHIKVKGKELGQVLCKDNEEHCKELVNELGKEQ